MQVDSTRSDDRQHRQPEPAIPVLAFCGWSGSGKTTLLESLIPRLAGRGLAIAAVKHDAHGVQLDTPGKDSDRLFRAGATVCLRGPDEGAIRMHRDARASLSTVMQHLAAGHDLVLVEGHKSTPWPKIWLEHRDQTTPPTGVSGVVAELAWGDDRISQAEDLVVKQLDRAFGRRRILGGILVGGRSRRMGTPKQLIRTGGLTMVERVHAALAPVVQKVVLLGDGRVPPSLEACRRVPDVEGSEGPLAGILAGLRWSPDAAWIIAACDLPMVTAEAVRWLAGERRPGRWAVMPRTTGGLEPLLAAYEPQAGQLFEALASSSVRAPWRISEHPKVSAPEPPPALLDCWVNANTLADLEPFAEGAR